MKNTLNIGVILGGVVCAILLNPPVHAQEAPSYAPGGGYNYSAPNVGQQGQYPAYGSVQQGQYQYPAYGSAPQEQYPGYGVTQQEPYPAYGYEQQGQYPAYPPQQSAYAGDPSAYAQPGYDYLAPAYGYTQPGYDYGYGDSAYGYAQQPYVDPAYGTGSSAYYDYAQQPGYAYPPTMSYPGYDSSSGYGGFPGNAPWDNLNTPDIFGSKSPFQDPLQHEGYWTKKNFQPWRTGPFAYDKWDNHPATQMPWGNFPGWGKGFWGGFGPDTWEGATPWGNDVPFKWVDPTDPEESFAQIWEDALNTPNRMGRMPPGFTAPYISVPNPIDVENEFERNAKNAPDEIHKMWGDGGGIGTDTTDKEKNTGKDESGKDVKAGEAKGKEGKSVGGKPKDGDRQVKGDGWGWDKDWWNESKRPR